MGSLIYGESSHQTSPLIRGLARKRAPNCTRGVSIDILKNDAEPYFTLEGKIVPCLAYG